MGLLSYLTHIRSLPCLVCQHPAEAHHLMIVGGRGGKLKSGDEHAVPLCHQHHMELHGMGNEYRFWDKHGVDPIEWSEKEFTEWLA